MEQERTRIIAAVAQKPFMAGDQSGSISNQFCKLIPLLYTDGTRVDLEEFMNDGEIWWMLQTRTANLALPGKLIVGEIENARDYDKADPHGSQYQMVRETPKEITGKEGAEIVHVKPENLRSIYQITETDFQFDSDHPTSPMVLLRWKEKVYGPFHCHETHCDETSDPQWKISILPKRKDFWVYSVPWKEFEAACGREIHNLTCTISSTDQPVFRSDLQAQIRYKLLSKRGLDIFSDCPGENINLEPLDKTLLRHSKACLSRSKRQQLKGLLREVEESENYLGDTVALSRIISSVKKLNDKQEKSLNLLIDKLLSAGLLGEERLVKAEKRYAEEYIQAHSAALQSEIEKKIKVLRSKRREEENRLKTIKEKLEHERNLHLEKLRGEEKQIHEQAKQKIAEERKHLEKEKENLVDQENAIKKNLEAVTQTLKTSGDQVVNRFLTIAPLIQELGFMKTESDSQPEINTFQSNHHEPTENANSFKVPETIFASSVDKDEVFETHFFERFTNLVDKSGFSYREIDLQRFHLSVKCGDITILGGPSGTGKSSLPMLYAKALAGDEDAEDRPDYLVVNVSSSWMDGRDILGHVNTIEKRYFPSETGLYQHLICSHEEFLKNEDHSAIYLVCLDEMNLSQTEHYFSDFMQVLERPREYRHLDCFPNEVVERACPFHQWHRLHLTPALRFVGTVNFDETTRQLSDRLLDRANLINIDAGELPNIRLEDIQPVTGSGPRVRVKDFFCWRNSAHLPSALAGLLDEMRNPLQTLDSPLTPRSYRGICRFVASAEPVMRLENAFDAQITQRLLPRVRSIITEEHHNAFWKLREILEESHICAFSESLKRIDQIQRSEIQMEFSPRVQRIS